MEIVPATVEPRQGSSALEGRGVSIGGFRVKTIPASPSAVASRAGRVRKVSTTPRQLILTFVSREFFLPFGQAVRSPLAFSTACEFESGRGQCRGGAHGGAKKRPAPGLRPSLPGESSADVCTKHLASGCLMRYACRYEDHT